MFTDFQQFVKIDLRIIFTQFEKEDMPRYFIQK